MTRLALALPIALADATSRAAVPDHPPNENPSLGAFETLAVYADTRLRDPRYGSFARARMDHVSLQDLESLSLVTKDGLDILAAAPDDPIEIVLFLPAGMDPGDEAAFATEIERRLNARFHNAVFRVRKSYLSIPPESQAQSAVKAASEGAATGESEASAADGPISALAGQLRKWDRDTRALARKARLLAQEPESVDLAIGSLIGGFRSLAGAGYWIAVTGFNPFGLAQSAITIALNEGLSMFPTQVNKWKAEHKIPFWPSNPAIAYYNSHPLLKTAAVNELIVFAVQSSLRAISYLARPEAIASPLSMAFLRTFIGMSLLRTPVAATEDLGLVTLMKKGYLSRRSSHYVSNFFGLESEITGLLFASGRMRLVPLALAFELSSKALVFVLAKALPAKNHRMIVLPSALDARDRDQIEYANELRELVLSEQNVPGSRLRELVNRYNLDYGDDWPSPLALPGSRPGFWPESGPETAPGSVPAGGPELSCFLLQGDC